MTRAFLAVALLIALATPAAAAHGGGHGGGGMHGGGYHGGYHGYHGGYHHHGSHVFVGGSVFFDPYWYGYPYYYSPYGYYPYYPYGYGAYPDYPPPPDEEAGAAPGYPEAGGPEAGGPEAAAPEAEAPEASPSPSARIGTYGLVQLHGVPDGAAVDLDGRFWLTADGLDDRWLALPEGNHTVSIHVGNATPLRRTFDVRPGASTVVRFPSPRRG